MVHYVECGTNLLREYGDAGEQYYISMETVFENSLKLMQQCDPSDIDDFKVRLTQVVQKAPEGWGYQDTLSGLLDEYESSSRKG